LDILKFRDRETAGFYIERVELNRWGCPLGLRSFDAVEATLGTWTDSAFVMDTPKVWESGG
jgi:hypothetical protein